MYLLKVFIGILFDEDFVIIPFSCGKTMALPSLLLGQYQACIAKKGSFT